MKEGNFKVYVKSIKKGSDSDLNSKDSKKVKFSPNSPSIAESKNQSIDKNSMNSLKRDSVDPHKDYKSLHSHKHSKMNQYKDKEDKGSSFQLKDFKNSFEKRDAFFYKDSLMNQKDLLNFLSPELLNWLKSLNAQMADLYKHFHYLEDQFNQMKKDFNFNLGSTLNQLKKTEDALRGSLQRMETRVSLLNACLLEKKMEEIQIKNLMKGEKEEK